MGLHRNHGAQDTVEAIGFTVQDVFNDGILIDGVVDRLADQFVVEGAYAPGRAIGK